MSYAKQIWTPHVTPLDAAHMTHIEDGIAAAAPAAAIAYGAAPPAAPAPGDLWVYPADAANGVMWLFRNAGGAYPWQYLGGSRLYAEALGTDTVTSASPVNVPNGPTLTLARAGDYMIEAEAIASSTVADGQCWLNAGDSTVAASALLSSSFGQQPTAGRWSTPHLLDRAAALPVGLTLALKGWGTGTVSYQVRRLAVVPVRVA